ncbi:MFS transporter [Mycolicibacterium chitae]|uniref:Major facilitator superfamily MFS_1 n=1 Tax=Mycolicibacterium chitae TaxID=1792 RepID=A0A448I434_MYCCI|nr:MFS transporter [Mycolicibacterium chitae]MCV7108897.1 MFS transporter [Mycolicibacterium chitae]BBZ03583.1 MFS transporter [Mycolicibacterium chitae]VEG47239.1 Major facilitator superfamily MFS_1 [Mycolicibacterium chitae]
MTQPPAVTKSRVAAWALWDCGFVGLNAIVVTFVFSVYLTESVGEGMPGGASPASWLGRALTIAGLTVAVLAPATGVWVQAPHLRRRALTVLTGMAVLLTASMSLIHDNSSYLFAGLVLLAATAACGDLAGVPYNAMLRQLSTPATSGRISGLGSGAGYFGSVLLLVIVYVGFIMGDGPTRGLLGLSVDDGFNVRMVMLVAAAWFALFAIPLLLTAQHITPAVTEPRTPISMLGAYRQVWSDLRMEWRRDRNLVYYLLASAVFRDGLVGVFTFGAVLGVKVYGISQADVLIFGMAALVIAAAGAVLGGHVDDRIGAKPVIVGSLTVMVAVGLVMLALSGPTVFWICGLALCLFLGPTQASARNLLLRMSADGREGVAFGLYTMTGRAVSFLAPWLFFLFVDAFGTDRAGLAGILVVLTAGLTAMLFVRTPGRYRADEPPRAQTADLDR